MPDIAPPWIPNQLLRFTAQAATSSTTQAFTVLALDPPTIRGGFTKINTIDRPRRKGFTMPVGWDPISLDVPIRFEAVTDYGNFNLFGSPDDLELGIQKLEWMAGRGKLYDNGSHPAEGDPPTVWVGGPDNKPSYLIPHNLHGSSGHPSITFLISNLTYDEHPVRGTGGFRRRQDVVVSLVEQVTVPGVVQSPRQRQHGRGDNGFQTFTSTQSMNTIQKICLKHGLTKAKQWAAVVAFNRNNGGPKVRSYTQPLKPGTKVKVPNSLFGYTFGELSNTGGGL